MNTPTFTYVEEYMEYIGGYRSAAGKVLGLFDQVPSPLSLARYDITIVQSLAEQTAVMNNGYTDKQAALVTRIIEKYRRQLSNLSIVLPDELTNFKFAIRIVDRSKRAYVQNDTLNLRFPYDTKLIELVKKQTKEAPGHGEFDYDNKIWKFGLTEDAINWIVTIAPKYEIELDPAITDLFNQILEVEQRGFKIELTRDANNQLTITNAASSLLEYINTIGGLNEDNLVVLVDNSEVLGYTVDESIREQVKAQYPEYWTFISAKNIKLTGQETAETFKTILDYAKLTNRLPLYVYEQGLPKNSTDEIVYLNRGAGYNVVSKLLVTTTSVMIGSKKESWLGNAEKIIILE